MFTTSYPKAFSRIAPLLMQCAGSRLVTYCGLVLLSEGHTYNTLPADKPLSSLLQLVFVQWRFLMFNVLKGHSAMFGTHPWHWYKTLQQLPLTLATILSPKVSESGSSSCPGNLSTTALHSPVLQQSPQYTGSTGSGRLDCSGI